MHISHLKNKHRAEYFKLTASLISGIESDKRNDLIIEDTLKQIVDYISKLSEIDKTFLLSNPELYINRLTNVFLNSGIKFSTVFRDYVKECWAKSLQLGIQHQIEDVLWQFPAFQPLLLGNRSTKISSFSLENFSSLILDDEYDDIVANDNESIAEFESRGNRDTSRAERNRIILLNNIQELKRLGVYGENVRYDSDPKLNARLSINEQYRFLESINFIGNFVRKAQVANRYYLGRNYFNQRISVLDTRYSYAQNNQIKKYIADYLKDDRVSLQTLLKKEEKMSALIRKIEAKVLKDKNKKTIKEDANVKAKAILRTELSIGYNIGKLSGFLSPEDWDTEFQWNASFELEYRRAGYEVCQACAAMHGRIFKAREILEESVRLDTSLMSYDARQNKTRWKDQDNPQIPFHVNCSCFWQIIPPEKKDQEEILQESLSAKEEKKQENIQQQLLNPSTLIGAGLLLVGTGLILSRSNAWKEVAKAIPDMPIGTNDPVENVTEIVNVASDQAKNVLSAALEAILGRGL